MYIMPLRALPRGGWKAGIIVAVLLLAVALLAITPSQSSAQILIPGWWTQLGYDPYHTSFIPASIMVGNFSGTVYRAWSFIMPAEEGQMGFYANPIIADVDGDGINEIVVTDGGGRLLVLYGGDVPGLDTNNFTTLYKLSIYVNASYYSAPALADVDNDGVLEAIVGCRDGYVRCVDLNTGALEWEAYVGINIASSPLVYDIDSDGVIDVIITSANNTYRINGKYGNIVWKSSIGRGLQSVSSPVLLDDINGDNIKDIAVANLWGYIAIIDGKHGDLIRQVDLWSTGFKGLFIVHSPISADIDGDGIREIIVSAGIEILDRTASRLGYNGSIIAIDPKTGSIDAAINTGGFAWFSQPAIAAADIDKDGMDEVFIAGCDGYLYRLDYDGTNFLATWRYQYDPYWPAWSTILTSHAASIAIADLNNDTVYEIALVTPYYTTTTVYRVYIINTLDGSVIAANDILDKYTVASYAPFLVTDYDAKATLPSLSIGDVDKDTFAEIIVASFQVISCVELS